MKPKTSYPLRPAARRGSVPLPATPPAVPAVLESLEVRRLLSAALPKVVARPAAAKFVPGAIYRPASDNAPTGRAAALARARAGHPTGRSTLAFTDYVQLLPKGVAVPSNVGSTTPVGLTATDVRRAYGMDTAGFNGVTGDGSGQTIAIVDAYDHPGFVTGGAGSADPAYLASDLHQFSVAMGLPDPPSFTKLDQTGGTNYPAPDAGWAAEIALDVEWAHAMAPMANIVLVEASSNSFGNLVQGAVAYARTLPGVSAVSMSFGADGGFAGESFFDPTFTTPTGHAGVTFLAATGDHGAVTPSGGATASAAYPAESPNVLAVGGTTLSQDATGYLGETGWSGSGGGVSNFESRPAYQTGLTTSTTSRSTPDVSIDADPMTGVAVYDSFNNNDPAGGGWNAYTLGGTSLSTPLWAGVVSVANQGRALRNAASLNGPTQTLPRVYQLPAAALHDVTTGSNGYAAAAGYDLVTGRGTPTGNPLLTALAGGTYTGTTYVDKNGNRTFDGTDTLLPNVTVYNDVNGNGSFDANETTTTSNASGAFTLDLVAGVPLAIRESVPGGYVRTTNGSITGTGTTAYGNFAVGGIGNFPTTYALPAGNNTVTLRLDATGKNTQIFVNAPTTGAPTYTILASLITTLTFTGNTGDDTLTADFANGSPLLSAGVTFNGGTETTGDTFNVVNAATAATPLLFTATGIGFSTRVLTLSGVEVRTYTGRSTSDTVTLAAVTAATTPVFVGGGGADTINVSGGVYTPRADLGADGTAVTVAATGNAAVTFATPQHLAGLSLASGATAALTGPLLRTANLSIDTATASALDLGAGGLIVDYSAASPAGSPAATVAALIAAGYSSGAWTGAGIRSNAAATDPAARHGLGVGEAASVLGLSDAATAAFLGETVDATTVLVRYTVYGDATLDGTVNFNDFLALQANFGGTGKLFADGDFDYDGDVDFNDFLRLQANFGGTA